MGAVTEANSMAGLGRDPESKAKHRPQLGCTAPECQ